ncbi:cellobiohydrolaseI [Vararia minispora EC-137]|uniref:CellobiohydrolaseI n=1 Tax=Vararia minispora EC-137 TaxID=1314806 RepID=A0ACB8QPP6_9AGAM|nr:cellobiohydrolaseI [Vararia minispora EC-137]
MFQSAALLAFSLAAVSYGQQVGTNTAETHPSLPFQTCTASGSCTTVQGKVVIDSNWRWVHGVGSTTNCYTGNTWDATLCPDDATCAANCALDGADYSGTYGITASGNGLTLKFVTQSANKNIGSRTYLMASDTQYQIFKLKNNEFTFDVDMSQLPCGLNGALYFVQMDADGGMSRFPTNKAGAKYGTGYCDSQCPRDIKFINGQANVQGWASSPNDTNAGTGNFGTCCAEMDIWEANSQAAAVTPHPCTVTQQTRCSGTTCGGTAGRYAGVCDPDGCDFNSWRMGNETFLGSGSGFTIDTTQKITVVTQFFTADNTSTGALSEIRRFYVQNGKVIPNSFSNVAGMTTQHNSISDNFCTAQKTAFGDTNSFSSNGGLVQMGTAMDAGMVLVMSVWDDHAVNMLWLDSDYPTTAPATQPGISRGPCATTSGVPATVEAQSPNAQVTYSNIKFGPIGSTFSSSGTGGSSPGTGNGTPPAGGSGGCSTAKYGQCGGIGEPHFV